MCGWGMIFPFRIYFLLMVKSRMTTNQLQATPLQQEDVEIV